MRFDKRCVTNGLILTFGWLFFRPFFFRSSFCFTFTYLSLSPSLPLPLTYNTWEKNYLMFERHKSRWHIRELSAMICTHSRESEREGLWLHTPHLLTYNLHLRRVHKKNYPVIYIVPSRARPATTGCIYLEIKKLHFQTYSSHSGEPERNISYFRHRWNALQNFSFHFFIFHFTRFLFGPEWWLALLCVAYL